MMLENIDTHDQDHYMRFELAESDYDYRNRFSPLGWARLNSMSESPEAQMNRTAFFLLACHVGLCLAAPLVLSLIHI